MVGFAAWFSGILPVSKQRSGCGNAVVGFAVRFSAEFNLFLLGRCSDSTDPLAI